MLHRSRSLRVLSITLTYLLLFDTMAMSALQYVPPRNVSTTMRHLSSSISEQHLLPRAAAVAG